MHSRVMVGLGASAIALLALVGCGGRSPEATADAFFKAANRKDEAGIKDLLTNKARAGLSSGNSTTHFGKDKPVDYTVGSATTTGDEAVVPVTVKETGKEQPMKFRMRREEGQWRIYAMAVPLTPGGPDMTIDLEHPEAIMGEMFKGMGEAMAKGMKAMGEGMGAGMKAFGEGMKKGLDTPGAPKPQ